MSAEHCNSSTDSAGVDRAIYLLSIGETEASLALLNELLAADPGYAKAFCARGSALRALGRYDEAIRDYEAALRIEPEYARAHFNRGIARFEQQDYEGAVADFAHAIAVDSEPGFYYHRALCLIRIGKYVDAVQDLSECIERGGEGSAAFLQRGIASSALGDAPSAIADFQRAAELDAKNPQAHVWLGHQLSCDQEYERAVASLDQAIGLSGGDGELYYRRGCALYHARDLESAVRDITRAIALGVDNAEAYHWRGRAWQGLADFEGAVADQTAAIARDDRHFDAFLARGQALVGLDRTSEAVADFTAASQLDPGAAKPFEHRAYARLLAGDDRLALADLDRALELDPKVEGALRARCQLHAHHGSHLLAEADLDALARLDEKESKDNSMTQRQLRTSLLLAEHFGAVSASDLVITERQFPFRVRADLQRAMDGLFDQSVCIAHFSGVKKEHSYEGINFSDLLYSNPHGPALAVPAQYEEVDVGEREPVRCLKNGLWLLEKAGLKFAVFLTPAKEHGRSTGMQFQIAAPQSEIGARTTQDAFKALEEAVLQSRCYRGKILSLEKEDYYSGMSSGIRVHKLRPVDRDQVILPAETVALLDRNVVHFARQRPKLAKLGLSTKKGILFYGPPGTGKTHTIHYLAGAMQGHTTLLITAEQVGLLSEYMTLARLLQPSIVVIEDADLIARDRHQMESACEEVLLNKLLNEMDGLRPETDVFFILTTNRPEALEAALSSRPGRIDQAIEFPLPDDDGRRKLVRLYARGLALSDEVVDTAVRRTERVSASFIKELMRRAAQFQLEREGAQSLISEDIERALEELLFAGGTLNCRLLGMQRDGER